MIAILVAIAAVFATAGVVGWMTTTTQHPERTSTHDPPDRTTRSSQRYSSTGRPAGPDAEPQSVGEPGDIAPGPER